MDALATLAEAEAIAFLQAEVERAQGKIRAIGEEARRRLAWGDGTLSYDVSRRVFSLQGLAPAAAPARPDAVPVGVPGAGPVAHMPPEAAHAAP